MQTDAENGHLGETRWTNIDPSAHEITSSHDAVVGVLVGYGVAPGRKRSHVTKSRKNQAEVGLKWDMVPPLCRPELQGPMSSQRLLQNRRGTTGRIGRRTGAELC